MWEFVFVFGQEEKCNVRVLDGIKVFINLSWNTWTVCWAALYVSLVNGKKALAIHWWRVTGWIHIHDTRVRFISFTCYIFTTSEIKVSEKQKQNRVDVTESSWADVSILEKLDAFAQMGFLFYKIKANERQYQHTNTWLQLQGWLNSRWQRYKCLKTDEKLSL